MWPGQLIDRRVYLGLRVAEGWEPTTNTMGRHGSMQAWWLEQLRTHISNHKPERPCSGMAEGVDASKPAPVTHVLQQGHISKSSPTKQYHQLQTTNSNAWEYEGRSHSNCHFHIKGGGFPFTFICIFTYIPISIHMYSKGQHLYLKGVTCPPDPYLYRLLYT